METVTGILMMTSLSPETGTTYVMFNNLSMFQDGLRFKEIWVREEDDGT